MGACLPNASMLGVAQLRVGSGIQQRNWSLSRCAAASSPASCRRMGGFPGPKRSLVAIILAIELDADQVERDQGGPWKGCRARRIGWNTASPFSRRSAVEGKRRFRCRLERAAGEANAAAVPSDDRRGHRGRLLIPAGALAGPAAPLAMSTCGRSIAIPTQRSLASSRHCRADPARPSPNR